MQKQGIEPVFVLFTPVFKPYLWNITYKVLTLTHVMCYKEQTKNTII